MAKLETVSLGERGSSPTHEEIQLLNSLTLHFCWYRIHLKLSTVGFADVVLGEWSCDYETECRDDQISFKSTTWYQQFLDTVVWNTMEANSLFKNVVLSVCVRMQGKLADTVLLWLNHFQYLS